MKRPRTAFLASLILGGAFLASLILGGISLRAQDPAPAGEGSRPANAAPKAGFALGVVDFLKVIAAYPRAIQERKSLDEFTKQRRAQLQAEERKAQEIKIKRDDLLPGTFDRDLKDHELRQKVNELDGLQKVFENDLRRRLDEYHVAMQEDMQRAVAEVAKDRGIALVLRIYADLPDGTVDAKVRLFDARMVWYAAAEIDLTDAVIQRLQTPLPDVPTKAPQAPKDSPTPKETTGGKPGN